MSEQRSALLGLFAVSLIWGCNYIASVFLLRAFSPIFISFGRICMTSIFFIIMALIIGKLRRPTKKEWGLLTCIGIFATFFNQTFYFTGLHLSSATNASLIFSMVPVCTTILERIFLKEKLTIFKSLGVALGSFGVVIIVSSEQGVHGVSTGDVFLILSMLAQSIGILFTRRLSNSMTSYALTIYSTVIGTGFMGASAIGEHIFSTTVISHSVAMWVLLVVAGIISQGVANFWWNKGVAVAGAGTSAMFLNIPPIIVLILSYLILGDRVYMSQILGGALVLLGVYVANKKASLKAETSVALSK